MSVGCRDLDARLRFLWLIIVRLRARRAVRAAEAELGGLGWDQMEFEHPEIVAHVKQVQEYEVAQAKLHNDSAEASAHYTALAAEMAQEKRQHEESRAILAKEREEATTGLAKAEEARREWLEAVERIGRGVQDLEAVEIRLKAQLLALLRDERPGVEVQSDTRVVNAELARLPSERLRILAEQASAAQEAVRLETEIANLREALREIELRMAAARARLLGATQCLTGQMSHSRRRHKKSHRQIARLDRRKQKPYREIGACMADNGVFPRNQPEALEKVQTLRARIFSLTVSLGGLRAAYRSTPGSVAIPFYLLLAVGVGLIGLLFYCIGTHRI